jgi:hypothetical protein
MFAYAAKIRLRENLTSEIFYRRNFPNLRYVNSHTYYVHTIVYGTYNHDMTLLIGAYHTYFQLRI